MPAIVKIKRRYKQAKSLCPKYSPAIHPHPSKPQNTDQTSIGRMRPALQKANREGPGRRVLFCIAPSPHYFRRASNILIINPTMITPETVYPKKLIQGIPNHCGIVRT